MLAEGMKRDLAAAAELGVSQAAAAEIVEEGVPAEIDGKASGHGKFSLTGPLDPPVESSPVVTRLCRCTAPDGHTYRRIGAEIRHILNLSSSIQDHRLTLEGWDMIHRCFVSHLAPE